ncbi:MAG TPA: cell division protein ZipA C-terminal FtsZ-binding domain-containing protein [Steroidobacteraceae bacterium]|nr:cell division protein ZipA C-terminal FtsZ-binding domain-containing protein [Steroidobacteraceae bacterium]
MSQLRVILLIAGLLFIAGIAVFEWWRARRSRQPATVATRDDDAAAEQAASASRNALPEIHVVREPRIAVAEKLPVIELDSTSASGTRRALGIAIADEVATDTLRDAPREPVAPAPAPPARAEPYIGQDDEVGQVRVYEEQPVRGPQLVIAWPKEAERRIVSLRVVPRGEPRFAGRALRQAFASAGFWHGPLDIFHLPDDAGRVVISAAALAQPGTFDPSIMDSQRFSGLSLFAVLPGPMSERDAFDTLVGAARALAERLEGAIHDQHGEELTAARIARLRESIQAPMQARAAGED